MSLMGDDSLFTSGVLSKEKSDFSPFTESIFGSIGSWVVESFEDERKVGETGDEKVSIPGSCKVTSTVSIALVPGAVSFISAVILLSFPPL